MKAHLLVTVAALTVALAAPAEGASKKHKKPVKRVQPEWNSYVVPANPHPHDVYISGELVGRDPDPFIRHVLRQRPRHWEGGER